MRKLLLIVLLVFGTTAAQAVPADCLAVLGTTGTLSSLLSLSSEGCFHQDKIFSNFTYTGAGATQQPASMVNVSHVFQVLPTQDIHGWLIAPVSGQWTTAFNFGWTVTICTTLAQGCSDPNPFANMVAYKQQINSGVIPNGSIVTSVNTPNVGSPFTVTTSGASAGNETVQVAINPAATQMTSMASFNGVGNLASLEQDVVQSTAIPEPATMALIGSGLLLVGFARRRMRR
jgi:hypothetical protein